MVESTQDSWSEYFAKTTDQPVHEVFTIMEPHLARGGAAIDLGCGAGRGTVWLADRGFVVTAVDASEEALDYLRPKLADDAPVTLVHSTFQDLSLDRYDVAVATYTLFFMPPEDFAPFWQRLRDAIVPGGLFAGQFLGVNDTWADRGYSTNTRADVDRLLDGFDVLHLAEDESDGETATESPKHWHVFHVVARRTDDPR